MSTVDKEQAERVFRALEEWRKKNDRMTDKGCRPLTLARSTKLPKNVVNNALYNHLSDRVVRVQDVPPLWNIKTPPNQEQQQPSQHKRKVDGEILLFIDLGNVHDCLVPATDLACAYAATDDGTATVIRCQAYADRAYNGSEMKTHGQYIWQAYNTSSHAADVKMVMDVTSRLNSLLTQQDVYDRIGYMNQYVRKPNPIQHLILASRDKFVNALAEQVRQEYANIVPEVSVVTCWHELRQLLEM